MSGRPRSPTTCSDPLVRQLFDILDSRPEALGSVAQRAGITPQTFWHWRQGRHTPAVFVFDAVLQALGYRLAIVKTEAVRHG